MHVLFSCGVIFLPQNTCCNLKEIVRKRTNSMMSSEVNIMDFCSKRILRHQEESRNDLREKWNAIKRSAASLLSEDDYDDERPFMIPRAHNPYDIWYSILDVITDPKEIAKLWDGIPVFRQVLSLKKKYVQTRLPQIFQLILDKYPKLLVEVGEMRLSRRNRFQWQRTVLKLRLISKVCKNSVEELLQVRKYVLVLKTTGKVWNLIESIQGMEIIADTFFPSNVKVMERHRQLEDGFLEAIGIFLELVGKRVMTFGYRSVDTVQHAYGKLREWVLYMPNLEKLELAPLRWRGRGPRDDEVTSFEEIQAFPNCPNLTSFNQLEHMLPKAFVQHILDANPQINAVLMPEHMPVAELLDPAELNCTLRRLECFRTPMCTSLLSTLDFRCSLKKIVLHGPYRFHTSSQELFTFLHQFRDSLEHFELCDMDVKMTDNCFLDLPLLKFIIWRNKTFKDLRFLLHAQQLEEIHVSVGWYNITYPESFSDGFFMKVTNGFDGLNLWDVFPRLQIVLLCELFQYTLESVQNQLGIAPIARISFHEIVRR